VDISSLILDFDIVLDLVDKKIILSITQGFTSPYYIWVAMKNESKAKHNSTKPLVYKNIYLRTIALSKAGYLEELKVEGINIHGRREYRVTLKGLQQLLPYYIAYPNEIGNLNKYMDKAKIEKQPFTKWLIDIAGSIDRIINIHQNCIKVPVPHPLGRAQSESIDEAIDNAYEQLRHYVEINNLIFTIQNVGTKRSWSLSQRKTPHTREELAELARQNIEKLKKTYPRNAETIKEIEDLITRSPYRRKPKFKTSKSMPLTKSVKS
jgi:hypothetical protein